MSLEPEINGWKKARQNHLLQQLDKAMSTGKLSQGIKAVWNTATHKRGKLLVVEEGYPCTECNGTGEMAIYPASPSGKEAFYIKDVIDDVIEKVLKDGGDVEFVDAGLLKEHQHIALIEYYHTEY